jgi:hypothetical protein
MSFDIIRTTLASALAAAGTFTVGYPQGSDTGSYYKAFGHKIVTSTGDTYSSPTDFTVTLGASSVTVTSVTMALAAGTALFVQFEKVGQDDGKAAQTDIRSVLKRTVSSPTILINLGAPDTADIDSMIDGATSTELPNATSVTYTPATNGTTPTDGVQPVVTLADGTVAWELDVPRALTATITHGSSIVAMTFTIQGRDEYGVRMTETGAVTATGTSKTTAFVKAFKWVTSIKLTAAGDSTANTVEFGFGDVLGLPVFVPDVACVAKEIQDAAVATAGTLVGGGTGTASATSADVRGTYDPNAAADAAKVFRLIVSVPDPTYKGLTQYYAA